MKTILVDAWNTFVTQDGVFVDMQNMLDEFANTKIILTNANDEQLVQLGIVHMPYEVFTLKHNPDKVDPTYYTTMLQHFNLATDDVVYFEHNTDAVKSARSVGIQTYHYDKDVKDFGALKDFLVEHI